LTSAHCIAVLKAKSLMCHNPTDLTS